MVEEVQLEPGWLGGQLDQATHSVRAGWPHGATGIQYMKKCETDHDRYELFKILDRRFESWTGMTLVEYVNTINT